MLLSGRLAEYTKYAGKHVLVIKDKIVPLKEGEQGRKDISLLEKKYGQKPVLTYVPRKDISYILPCLNRMCNFVYTVFTVLLYGQER